MLTAVSLEIDGRFDKLYRFLKVRFSVRCPIKPNRTQKNLNQTYRSVLGSAFLLLNRTEPDLGIRTSLVNRNSSPGELCSPARRFLVIQQGSVMHDSHNGTLPPVTLFT